MFAAKPKHFEPPTLLSPEEALKKWMDFCADMTPQKQAFLQDLSNYAVPQSLKDKALADILKPIPADQLEERIAAYKAVADRPSHIKVAHPFPGYTRN